MAVNTGGQRKAAYNSTYTQVGFQYFYESEVLNPRFVLLMKFSAKNPHLRIAARRCRQAATISIDNVTAV